MGTSELALVGLAGSGVGTALALPMLWPRARRAADVRLMGGWLVGLSLLIALISARLLGIVPASAAVSHLINVAGLVSYPLVYLHLLADRGQQPARAGRGWLWAPAAAYLAVLLARSLTGADTRVPFVWMLPVVLAFSGLCVAELLRHRAARTRPLVPAGWIVVFMIAINVAQIVRMTLGHVPFVPALIPVVVTGGFVALLAAVVWRLIDREVLEPVPAVMPTPQPRYAKSGLDRDAALAVLARIDDALSQARLFADPQLTPGRLAAIVEAPPHQISEALNRYSGVTFNELLNRRRVEDVKRQLLDPASDRFTIEGIGAAAGFGSRSAMYAAFKRLEGVTPAEFRAQRRARPRS